MIVSGTKRREVALKSQGYRNEGRNKRLRQSWRTRMTKEWRDQKHSLHWSKEADRAASEDKKKQSTNNGATIGLLILKQPPLRGALLTSARWAPKRPAEENDSTEKKTKQISPEWNRKTKNETNYVPKKKERKKRSRVAEQTNETRNRSSI